MALAERATGSGTSTAGSPVAVTLSSAPVSGDLILVFFVANANSADAHPTPSFSGNSSLGSSTASSYNRLTCLGKVATGSEGTSLSVSYTGSADHAAVGALVISGAAASVPTNVITTADASSDTTVSIAAITTTAANSWDVVGVCFGGNNDYAGASANYSAWGSSLVEKFDLAASSGGFEYAGLGVAYVARATAAVQAATSVTQSTSDVAGVIRVEVKEASAGGSVTVNLSGAPNNVALTTVDPTTILGSLTLNLTAAPNSVVLATVDPSVVLGSISLNLTASPNAVALTTVDPSVIQGSVTVDLAAAPNSVALTTVNPTVSAGGDVSLDLSAAPSTLTLTTVDPTVTVGGNLTLNLSASPNALALTVVDPTVVLSSTTANLAAAPNILALTTANPTVTIADAFALPLSTVTTLARPIAVSAPRRPVGATTKATTPAAATTLV